MQKWAKIILFIIVLIVGIISASNAQTSDVIDKIEIVAIKSMHVQSNILILVTDIKNSNKEKIKLSEGEFTFYLRTNKAGDDNLTEDEALGTDKRDREIFLDTADNLMDKRETEINEVIFEINLGEDQAKVISSLQRIINAIGNSSRNDPIFYINGRFYLGVKSDKGWSSVRAKINWVFRPEFQRKVLLEASLDLPVPHFPDTEDGIRKDWTEKCRVAADIKFKLDSDEI